MGAAPGTIPSLPQYQPYGLALCTTIFIEIVDSYSNFTTAASWAISQQDFVGKAPSVMNYAVPTGSDAIAFYQKSTGLPVQCNIGDIGGTFGNLPAGGGTGTLLVKAAATAYAANWTSISSLITAGAAMSVAGSTTLVISIVQNSITAAQIGTNAIGAGQIATASIGSGQIATNAIGTAQLATSVGFTGSLSVGGTAIVTGTTILNGGLQVSGTSLMTGTFGVAGTAAFTGAFGIVGTTLVTAAFGVVGTANFTGSFNIVGTTNVTGALVLNNQTGGVLVSSGTGVVSAQGGMVLLNTLSPNAVASIADITSLTSTYRNYMIMFDTVCPATQTTTLQITLATSGSAFTTAGYVSVAAVNVSSVLVTDTSTAAWLLTGTRATTQMQTSTVVGASGFIKIFNPSSSVNQKTMVGEVTFATPGAVGTTTFAQAVINGFFNNASPVTGINFAFNSGNIQTGTIKIYGMT